MDAVADWCEGSMERETKVLARALSRRDPDVIDLLIERYQYRLMRYLLSLAENRQGAEDLFQETWMRVLEQGHQYDGKSSFGPWLFRIARNLAIDRIRRRKHLVSIQDLKEPPDLEGNSERFESLGASPLEQARRMEEKECIAAALSRVPAGYREVLVLRFQEDMPLEEIAGIVEAPLSTVKSRLYRGLELLREMLEGLK
jgi:RNA polymerase sigma-70 factor (ECF subfamily)